MVSAELGQRHFPASLSSSPCARHVRVSGNVMVCEKLSVMVTAASAAWTRGCKD